MIRTLKFIQRDFTLALSGFQETVVAIADHVNQHVQKVKRRLDTLALEKEIERDQIGLGKKIHASSKTERTQLKQETAAEGLIEKILIKQKQLESTEGIVSPYEALHDFERLLIRSNFVIQNIVILDRYSGIGKTIQELTPPSQMLIFFIKKRNKIELAYGKIIIDVRDEITFLCSKENIADYIAFWR